MHEFNVFFYSGYTMIQTIYIRFQGRIKNPVRHLRGCFVEIINGIEPLTILIKHFILNI